MTSTRLDEIEAQVAKATTGECGCGNPDEVCHPDSEVVFAVWEDVPYLLSLARAGVKLAEMLEWALDHVEMHREGCLYCGETVDLEKHRAQCPYHLGRAALEAFRAALQGGKETA